MLVQEMILEKDPESLLGHIDGQTHVFVGGLWRREELLPEDVEQTVAANEANQVISPLLGLGQRIARRSVSSGKRSLTPLAARAAAGVFPPSLL